MPQSSRPAAESAMVTTDAPAMIAELSKTAEQLSKAMPSVGWPGGQSMAHGDHAGEGWGAEAAVPQSGW